MRPAGSFGPIGTSFCAIAEAAPRAAFTAGFARFAATLRPLRWTSAAPRARGVARLPGFLLAGVFRPIFLAILSLRFSGGSLARRPVVGNPLGKMGGGPPPTRA